MNQQQLQSIVKTKRGRPRTKPTVQCSVCLEYGAVIEYQKRADKTYLRYVHPDKIIDVKYDKTKTGKQRRLIYKECYVGLVTEGLPIANELGAGGNGNGKDGNKTKSKIKIKIEKRKEIPKQIPNPSILEFMERELKIKNQDSLRLKNEIEKMKNPNMKPFMRVAYTRKWS